MKVSAAQQGRSFAVRQAALLAVIVVGGVLAVSWTTSRLPGPSFDVGAVAGLTLAFLAARLLTLQLPQGDQIRITIVVGLVALALRSTGEVLIAASVAGALDVAVRISQDGVPLAAGRLADLVRSVSVLALLSPWQVFVHPLATAATVNEAVLLIGVAMGLSYAILDVMTIAAQQWAAGGPGVPEGFVSLVRPLGSVYMVHIAMAAVVLRVYPSLGAWGLAIALLLTLILQNSFNLYLRIRRAYAQTIKALAHAAEMDRPQDVGHAERVADLAIAVGRESGLSSVELEHVGYGALLHDVGRIGYEGEDADTTHSARGAEIVEAIPFLEGVAPLIRHHRDTDDDAVPEGAVIVGVCCRYDRLRSHIGARAALERLEAVEEGRRLRAAKTLASVVSRRSGSLGLSEDPS
ncbi:MAG TPA: hypothetical protein DCP20_05265 [Coriobacteriia bacterium]|nr:hypothetical protein [Coriobacteriia bacterium]